MKTDSYQLQRVKEFYENQSRENPGFPAVLGEPNDFATAYRAQEELATFNEIMPLSSSDRFVEFGSGGGRWLRAVAPRVRECIGVELSTRCVELSRQRLAGYQNVSIYQSDIQSFTPESIVDVMYYSGVLLYLSENEVIDCLSKHRSYLSDAGYVLIRDSVSELDTHEILYAEGYAATYRHFAHWQELMGAQGLTLVTRVTANRNPISQRLKRSQILRVLHGFFRSRALEDPMLSLVSRHFGRPLSGVNEKTDYSHDFLLYRCRQT